MILQEFDFTFGIEASFHTKMATVSPSEDLCILAAIYNNPDMNWNEIAGYINQRYLKQIPAQLCEQRYETFLKYVDHLHEIAQIAPYLQYEEDTLEKMPENFIFHYVELKRKLQEASDFKGSGFVEVYQKKIISQFFYGIRCQKTKKIQKQNQKTMSNQSFINKVYEEIKKQSCYKTILNDKILCQKLEQIMFEIMEKTNDFLSGSEKIDSNVLKLFKPNCLIDERREIFQLYFQDKQLNQERSLLLAGKFNYVLTIFGYSEVLKNQYQQDIDECPSEKTHQFFDDLPNDQPVTNIQQNIQETNPYPQKVNEPLQAKFEEQLYQQVEGSSRNQNLNVANGQFQHQLDQNARIDSPNQDQSCHFNNLTQQQQILQEPRGQDPLQIPESNKGVSNNEDEKSIHNDQQIKVEAKIEEQVKMEIEQNDPEAPQIDKKSPTKRYRVVKRRTFVPAKMPRYSKTIIVIND